MRLRAHLTKSARTASFNNRYTMPCARSIPNGLNPMAIVLPASLTSYASQNCSVFRRRANIIRLRNQPANKTTQHHEYEY
jgi:hypothetical protein